MKKCQNMYMYKGFKIITVSKWWQFYLSTIKTIGFINIYFSIEKKYFITTKLVWLYFFVNSTVKLFNCQSRWQYILHACRSTRCCTKSILQASSTLLTELLVNLVQLHSNRIYIPLFIEQLIDLERFCNNEPQQLTLLAT